MRMVLATSLLSLFGTAVLAQTPRTRRRVLKGLRTREPARRSTLLAVSLRLQRRRMGGGAQPSQDERACRAIRAGLR